MSTTRDQVLALIYDAVDEVNETLSGDLQLDKSPETVLFGRAGKLDSVGLVNLVVAAEQRLEDDLDRAVSLSDERAMSQERSPFRTIGSLADYAVALLDESPST